MADWQPIETIPASEFGDSGWPVARQVLLWGHTTGVRNGEVFNWRGELHANIATLHGDAIESWGVTHWQPLPAPPSTDRQGE